MMFFFLFCQYSVLCSASISMYSRSTKSTSSAYQISLGIFSSNGDLGSPIIVRTSFRACSRYMVKSTGLSPSPWGVPTLLVKGAFISALFILVLMCVLLNKNCMSLSSPSSTMCFRICRRIIISIYGVKFLLTCLSQ